MNDFLGKYNLQKLSQEKVENLSQPITIEEIGNAVSESNGETAIKIKNTHISQLRNPTPGSPSHRNKSTSTQTCVRVLNAELFVEEKSKGESTWPTVGNYIVTTKQASFLSADLGQFAECTDSRNGKTQRSPFQCILLFAKNNHQNNSPGV